MVSTMCVLFVVAQQILRLAKCSVVVDQTKLDVKPFCLDLEPSVKFEVFLINMPLVLESV